MSKKLIEQLKDAHSHEMALYYACHNDYAIDRIEDLEIMLRYLSAKPNKFNDFIFATMGKFIAYIYPTYFTVNYRQIAEEALFEGHTDMAFLLAAMNKKKNLRSDYCWPHYYVRLMRLWKPLAYLATLGQAPTEESDRRSQS